MIPMLLALLVSLQTVPGEAATLQEEVYRARDRVLPALVHIEPVLELYRGGRRSKIAVTGSGVVVSEDGVVVTVNHVVEGARRVTCILSNQEEVPARVVGRDPLTDLAVLQLDLSATSYRPRPAELGSSSGLQAGQFVIALGSPLGLSRSLSVGVVSSPARYLPEGQRPGDRVVGSLSTWIQTDAAINPGNSGGPLVDLQGRVVGINARAIPIFGENLGFAIPVDEVREVSRALLEGGEVVRAWLGVRWQPLKALGYRTGLEGLEGAVVGGVFPDSPAARAGLRAGDVVLSMGGEPVRVRYGEELPALRKRIAGIPVGATVPVRFLRGGGEGEVRVRAERMPEAESEEVDAEAWGFTVGGITQAVVRQLRLADDRGVVITGVQGGGPAGEAGARRDDVVRTIGETEVLDLQGFRDAYRAAREAEPERVYLEVARGRTTRFLVIRPNYDD